jgi:hypothetical protein
MSIFARLSAVALVAAPLVLFGCSSAEQDKDDNDKAPPGGQAGRVDGGAKDAGVATDGGGRDADAEAPSFEGGAPAPQTGGYCSGFISCFEATLPECAATPGCRIVQACDGIARSCSSFFDRFSCSGQRGCYWSSSSNSCTGVANSCSLISEFSCTDQEGCRLRDDRCSGVANQNCSDFTTASACSRQSKCSWRE